MVKVTAVTLLLVFVLAAPAAAALKVLPDAQAQELEAIALEFLAAQEGLDVEDLVVEEGWVRELRALEIDIYHVVIMHDDDEYMVSVLVEEKAPLAEEEVEAMIEANTEETPEDAVYTLTEEPIVDGEGKEESGGRDVRTLAYWGAGAVLLLGLGTVMVKTRK